jgi:hypothetical protein
MNLLVEHTAQADRVDAEAAVLRSIIRIEMKLRCRMTVDMAIKARHAEARINGLTVVGSVEFLLRKRRGQPALTILLNVCLYIIKQPEKIINRDDFAARYIA